MWKSTRDDNIHTSRGIGVSHLDRIDLVAASEAAGVWSSFGWLRSSRTFLASHH